MKLFKKRKKVVCERCGDELDNREIKMGWKFGKIHFCGNACATAWAVQQHLK